MKMSIELDTHKFETELQKEAQERLKLTVTRVLAEQFTDTTQFSVALKTNIPIRGFMTQQIKERVDTFLFSDEVKQRIDKLIEENFDRLFKQAMERALTQNCNRLVFNRLREKTTAATPHIPIV